MSPLYKFLTTLTTPPSPAQTEERSGTYIMMEARTKQLFKDEDEYEVLAKFKGRELEGMRYQPLFDYFQHVSCLWVLC